MPMTLLPAMDQSLQPPSPNAGSEWGDHGSGLGVLAKYSAALSVPATHVAAERLKSVPSPWARLLLFEQALYSPRHPAHKQITSEWRGFMASIGLAPYLGVEVTAHPLDLRVDSGPIASLRTMVPESDAAESWERIVIIKIDGQVVGATSPRTLVFTGMRRVATGRIAFLSNGRLVDPTVHYREQSDKVSLGMLREWLDATHKEITTRQNEISTFLGKTPSGDGAQAIPRVGSLLRTLDVWRKDADTAIGAVGRYPGELVQSTKPSPVAAAFPQRHGGNAAFASLLQVYPVPDLGTENALQIRGSQAVVNPGRTGLLTRQGQPYSGDALLPRGMSQAVENGRFRQATDEKAIGSTLPDLGALFQTKLLPVAGAAPERVLTLEANGIAYVYPFRPEILRHLKPEELAAWSHISGEAATGLVVSLRIPLMGDLELWYEQKFRGNDILAVDQVTAPLVTAWPDFESDTWKHYFYVERRAVKQGLQLEPWTGDAGTNAVQEKGPGLRWIRTERPARAWQASFAGAEGVLVTKPLAQRSSPRNHWDVSIDFGSTHTRVFHSAIGAGGASTTREVRLTARATPILGSDTSILYNFFATSDTQRGNDAEPASLVWLPASDARANSTRDWMPSDGVMFWGAVEEQANTSGLRGNLKWHRDDPTEKAAFHSYAAQLYLSIAAEAFAQDAAVRSVITAYPSVLPSNLRFRHRMEWQELQRYQVEVKTPRSESDAVASYFESKGAAVAANLFAVDVGGSTSDLTVWLTGKPSQGDSIRFAGDILSRVMAVEPEARAALDAALRRPPFNTNGILWDSADPSKNGLILNSLLRTLSQHPAYLRERDVLAKSIHDGTGSAGERVVAYLAYMFATVSFVLGMLARKHGARLDRYDVRFAGKGAEYLHWLEALATGASTSIPRTFFAAGLRLPADHAQAHVQIVPPGVEAKQEVGRGLLLKPAGAAQELDDRTTFMGETAYSANGHTLGWDAQLDIEALRSLSRPRSATPIQDMEQLRLFVETFQHDPGASKAARALGISAQALDNDVRDRIHARLFDPQSAWQAAQGNPQQGSDALLEPFFVTEAKVLLEVTTKHPGLFVD